MIVTMALLPDPSAQKDLSEIVWDRQDRCKSNLEREKLTTCNESAVHLQANTSRECALIRSETVMHVATRNSTAEGLAAYAAEFDGRKFDLLTKTSRQSLPLPFFFGNIY